VQREAAAEGLDAVGEADEAGVACEVGAAAAVVADADSQYTGVGVGGHLVVDDGGGVLGRVGQRLRDDVVGGELNRLGQPPVDADVEADGDGGRRSVGPVSSSPGAVRPPRAPPAPEDITACTVRRSSARETSRCSAPSCRSRFDTAAGGVGGGHDPRPRRIERDLGLGVGDRGGDPR
jgi:hypothetical protein